MPGQLQATSVVFLITISILHKMETAMHSSASISSRCQQPAASQSYSRVQQVVRWRWRHVNEQQACSTQRHHRKARALVAASAASTAAGAPPGPAAGTGKSRPEYIPNRIDDPTYVRIFDTTLRDGEQSPGATLTSKEKLEIAKQLAKLGVDIIEAGFPVASPDDFDAVRSIALDVGNAVDADGYVPVICGLSRTVIRWGAPAAAVTARCAGIAIAVGWVTMSSMVFSKGGMHACGRFGSSSHDSAEEHEDSQHLLI